MSRGAAAAVAVVAAATALVVQGAQARGRPTLPRNELAVSYPRPAVPRGLLPLGVVRPPVWAHGGTSIAPSVISGAMTYHNGAVLHAPTTYAVFWIPSGYSVSAHYVSLITAYMANVATAAGVGNVYGVASEYSDSSGPVSGQLPYGGYVVDTSPFPASACSDYSLPVCLSQDQLAAELDRVVVGQGWPKTTNALYAIFTPQNVGSCSSWGTTMCAYTDYCAFHTSANPSDGGILIWANQPYTGGGLPCEGAGTPNGDDADYTINVLSHEQIEALTDPTGAGWYDSGGNEIADKCAWTFGSPIGTTSGGVTYNQAIGSGAYNLQLEWSNAANGCLAQAYVAPPMNSVRPAITGFPILGTTLSASDGTWTGSGTLTYSLQWLRCDSAGANCASISGATSSSYTLASADLGQTVEVQVVVSNGVTSASAVSPVSGVVSNPRPTPPPTVSSTAPRPPVPPPPAGGGTRKPPP